MENNKSLIDRTIWEITNPKPNCSLFTNYKDFMRNKHIIPYYKFNTQFLNQLLTLAEKTFEQNGRFNHTVMFDMIKIYIREHKAKLDLPTRERVFSLIKCYYEKAKISDKIENNTLSILTNLAISEDAEKWLCEMQDRQMEEECDYYSILNRTKFLNRILRYPAKSKMISNWISANYNNDHLRSRRAEAISWILNENADFVVDDQTLIDDFEFTNLLDRKIVYNVNEIQSQSEREKEVVFDNLSIYTENSKLCYRPYVCITYNHIQGSEPDFTELHRFFNENIKKIKSQTMLWAVAYSHLTDREKNSLIKKYYLPDLFVTAFKIAKKHRLVKLLIWLKTQHKKNNANHYHIELKNVPIEPKKIKPELERTPIREVMDNIGFLINTLDLEVVDECPF